MLGSVLKACNEIVFYLRVENLEPGVEEYLPSLTPILKNRNDDV